MELVSKDGSIFQENEQSLKNYYGEKDQDVEEFFFPRINICPYQRLANVVKEAFLGRQLKFHPLIFIY